MFLVRIADLARAVSNGLGRDPSKTRNSQASLRATSKLRGLYARCCSAESCGLLNLSTAGCGQ